MATQAVSSSALQFLCFELERRLDRRNLLLSIGDDRSFNGTVPGRGRNDITTLSLGPHGADRPPRGEGQRPQRKEPRDAQPAPLGAQLERLCESHGVHTQALTSRLGKET